MYAKPTSLVFGVASLADWTIDKTETVNLEGKRILYVIGHGTVIGDISGTFTFHDTVTQYLDSAKNIRYSTYNQRISLDTTTGTLIINAKVKMVPGTPLDEVESTWRILYGIGVMAAVSGGGTYHAWFMFEGAIR